jgi:hypothetical protein
MFPCRAFLITGAAVPCVLLMLCTVPPLLAEATSSGEANQSVRYHYGDDSSWADPGFDDSTWPVAQQQRWPQPAYNSDGFVWVRFRVPVRSDIAGPLAIRVGNPPTVLIADEVFVNGTSVGTVGKLPPRAWVNCLPQDAIFDLPAGLAQPGTIASVVLRLWYPPFARSSSRAVSFAFDQLAISVAGHSGAFNTATFTFDQSRTLHAEEEAVRARALLRNLPGLVLNGFILLIGALRTMPPLPPARILAALNRGLVGQMQHGFVTCCAARIHPGGAMILANAGHLAPYRSGEEMTLPHGLPLGLSAESEYLETTLELAPDDTLTFLSDGVVEARNATGELFGFERTREISRRPAGSIAEAAQRFGQEDDITVLTLAFTAAEVLHA